MLAFVAADSAEVAQVVIAGVTGVQLEVSVRPKDPQNGACEFFQAGRLNRCESEVLRLSGNVGHGVSFLMLAGVAADEATLPGRRESVLKRSESCLKRS
jgi:hypothetical protein